MKAYLMFRDQDFDLNQSLPKNEKTLIQDLELGTLFEAMSGDDDFLYDVAKKAVINGTDKKDTILYRQSILQDCIKNFAIVREIYQIPIESKENKKKHWFGFFSRSPSSILYSSIEIMNMFVGLLQKIRKIADDHSDKFESEGFSRFFAMIKKELDDDYFKIIQTHLRELKFRDGVLISAELGEGNEGTNYILRKPNLPNQGWMKNIFSQKQPVYTFFIHEKDDHGARALADLEDRGINTVANALAQSADHIDSFLKMLQIELAFYIGCLNLYEKLKETNEIITYPIPLDAGERQHSFRGLIDVCMALTKKQKIVGNDLTAENKDIVIITGANQGGKSTFLRSIGLAQLMMQSGMFVSAESFSANLCEGVFTHYKRKEDAAMKSGKLDEELSRMSDIADSLKSDALVLFNESFAATNEREGSEIARQITSALLEKQVKIFFVTHLYDFAHSIYEKQMPNSLFLKAERKSGGGRTFKLFEGEPIQTSYGKDVYYSIFEKDSKIPL